MHIHVPTERHTNSTWVKLKQTTKQTIYIHHCFSHANLHLYNLDDEAPKGLLTRFFFFPHELVHFQQSKHVGLNSENQPFPICGIIWKDLVNAAPTGGNMSLSLQYVFFYDFRDDLLWKLYFIVGFIGVFSSMCSPWFRWYLWTTKVLPHLFIGYL